MISFANTLKAQRQKSGLSLYDLSKKAGISPQALSDYELNKKIPSFTKAQEILNCFDVRIMVEK
jgi:transcriptional regulator with XRE-family HTH domain